MKKIFAILVFGFIAYYALWVRVLPESVSGWFSFFTLAIPIILFAAITSLHKADGGFWLKVGLASSIGIVWIVRDFHPEQVMEAYFLVATYLGLFWAKKLSSAESLSSGIGADSLPWPERPLARTTSSTSPPKAPRRSKAQIVKDEYHRILGITIEMRAVEALKLPRGWTKKTNLYHRLIGDVDLLVTSPTNNIFNVEIKAWHGVIEHNGELAKKHDNHKSVAYVERQLWRQVHAWRDGRFRQPVLWLPQDTENTFFEYQHRGKRGKIIVVNGDQETLKRAIKAI